MRVNSIQNSPAFGKTALMKCRVVNNKTKQAEKATLYEMDPTLTEDYREIHKIGDSRVSFYNFHNNFSNATVRRECGQKFYLVTSDDTDQPISGIETKLRYFDNATSPSREGYNTIVTEMAINKDYDDAELPVLAQVAKDSKKEHTANIITAFRKDEYALKSAKFSETKYGGLVLPARRYNTLLKIAAKKTYTKDIDNN